MVSDADIKPLILLDQRINALLAAGEEPDLQKVGGFSVLSEAIDGVAESEYLPEIVRILAEALRLTSGDEKNQLGELICRCVESTSVDMDLMVVLDLIDAVRPLPGNADDRCHAWFLRVAVDQQHKPMMRATALDGALRLAFEDRRKQLRLIDILLGLEPVDDPIFLSRAVKVVGVAHSHWREPELIDRLKVFLDVNEAKAEAAFELGMVCLAKALDAANCQSAIDAFKEARNWFATSESACVDRPDAQLFIACLDTLIAFHEQTPVALNLLVARLSEAAFSLNNWHNTRTPWLGARRLEMCHWNLLALRLERLANSLSEPSWYHPAVVVEEELLAVYDASRSVLRRNNEGGLEAVVRPTIEAGIIKQVGQLYHLRQWLDRNRDSMWSEAAESLIKKVDTAIEDGAILHPHPFEAVADGTSATALILKSGIPESAKKAAAEVVNSAFSVQMENLSFSEAKIIEDCKETASRHPDYHDNASGGMLFNAVLLYTVRFLASRLDMSRKHDRTVSYLFERDNIKLPLEGELQADYHRFMYGVLSGTEIEVENIGGGRADVKFAYHGERLIAEIKREMADCSFEALEKAYAAQAVDYQNTNIRLGFLLVLDLTEKRNGTPHIAGLVKSSAVTRSGEDDSRLLVTVKIPGRRRVPSDLSA